MVAPRGLRREGVAGWDQRNLVQTHSSLVHTLGRRKEKAEVSFQPASSILHAHGVAEVQIQDLTPLPPPTQSQEHKPFDLTQKGELLLSVLHLICPPVQEENPGGVQRCRLHF